MSISPADYPPPYRYSEFIARPTAGEDEYIEVGVLIVGAGSAGLAAANRFGQLLAEDEELMEELGEVPIAVAEKGKAAGSHLLSGAVMKPQAMKDLFPDQIDQIPKYTEVTGEAVYFLTKGGKIRIPAPPQMHNKGNWVVSVSQMGRWMAEQAEEAGAFMLPETDCQKILVDQGRVVGVVTGDKGRGKEGEELGTFEPGVEVRAKVTIFAEGTQGHLSQAARQYFKLDDESTQIWELGVKEVWEVPNPLDKVIHTAGWPLRIGPKYGEYGGSWLYPMGEDKVSIGFVIGLDNHDARLSAHDVLQEFKTHKFIREILDGGTRLTWGAKTIPSGGIYGLPSRLHVPGALFVGDAAGFVDLAALKGVGYAVRSGMIAAEVTYEALKAGKAETVAGLWGYDERIKDSEIWKDLWRVRNIRPAFQKGFFVGGMVHAMATASRGHFPKKINFKEDADAPVVLNGRRDKSYPKPDGDYIFDKLSSVFASGNQTRDDQPSHIRIQTDVPREIGTAWEFMCPAKVYEVVEDEASNGTVTVKVNPSNCVQCGAITAKGGRLTPPEGGSGPEYTLT